MLCLSATLIPVSVFEYSTQAGSTTVSISPQFITASVGQSFSINIDISNVTDLYGWEFKLGWNASLLEETNTVEGSFLKAGGHTFFSYNGSTGEDVVVDCALVGLIPGVSGDGTLATVTFYAKGAGECSLHLYYVTLLNSFELPIDCTTVDGFGKFTSSIDCGSGGKMPYMQ
jgi:hypothetical protein